MTGLDIFEACGNIGDDILERSEKRAGFFSSVHRRIEAAAACAVIALAAVCIFADSQTEANAGECFPKMIFEEGEIKTGRYYLVGGDGSQYILIKPDYGLEFVGFDFYGELYELNRGYIESLEAEGETAALEELLDDFRKTDEMRNSFHYYKRAYGGILPIPEKDVSGLGGWVLGHPDENTLEYTKEKIYVLEQ